MSQTPTAGSVEFSRLLNREVVMDMTSPFVIVGTLRGEDHRYLIFEDADVHDLRDTSSTREEYVLGARRHGISANRKQVLIPREQIVSLAALEDVLA